MGSIMNDIVERRSIRKYRSQPVPQDLLETLIKAASHAPSAMNVQLWHFTVIKNPSVIDRLTEALKRASHHESVPDYLAPRVDKPDYRIGYDAPVLILVSGERTRSTTVNDCTLAAGNIMLSAYSLGLGSCWINQPGVVCDVGEFRALLGELGVPADYRIYATVAVGYPEGGHPRAPERVHGTVNYVE